ncbi:acyl carrier protein [Streptomyces sp. NPDC047061]|uniref:acyl carrier protein n=1 Tax=Streptomyces sp. NPDC047061 TaxID=3154605 RepID=UPI0033C73889
MSETYLAALRQILADKLMVPHEQITAEATLEDIELDSLALVELSMLLEQEFAITVTDDELAAAATVGGIVRLIDERSVKL